MTERLPRGLYRFGPLALVPLALYACGGGGTSTTSSSAPAAGGFSCSASGTLTWYTDTTPDQANAFIKAFNQACSNVTVKTVRLDDSDMSTRFESEASSGVHAADVLLNVGFVMDEWVSKGLLLAYKSPQATGSYKSDYIEAGNHYYAYGLTLEGICVNTDVIKNPPTSWESLKDPQYDNQIVSQSLLKAGGASAAMIELRHYWNDDAKWTQVYSGIGKNHVLFGSSYTDAQSKVVSGERGILPVCYNDFISPAIDKGAPVKWIAPEPVLSIGNTVAIAQAAPNPAAAKAFVDFSISEAGQKAVVSAIGKVPARSDVSYPALASPAQSKTNVYTPTQYYLTETKNNLDFYNTKVKSWFGVTS